jgi:hypothetical protein
MRYRPGRNSARTHHPGIRLCAVSLSVLAILIARPVIADMNVAGTGEPPWAMAGPTLTPRPPAVGSLAGVHIAIPHEYLFFGVTYEGESAMDAKPRTKAPDLNTPIQSFSLLLHLPDLQPRRTAQDEKLWESQMMPRGGNFTRWWMGIEAFKSTWSDHGVTWVKTVVGRYLDANPSLDDVFHPAPDIDGLTRYVTTRLGVGRLYSQRDLMYDKNEKSTFITCDHMRHNGESLDYEVECVQIFYLDDLHVMVNLRYDDQYLPNWKLYQQKVTDLLRSFVVISGDMPLTHKENQ